MIDNLCDYLTNKIRKENPEIDDERAAIIDYGMHLIVGEIPKFFILIAISVLLGIWKQTLIAFIAILPYRVVSGGFHLKTHIGCIIGTILFYCGIPVLAKTLILNQTVKYIVTFSIWIFGMIMIKLYAPADTENVPIISKKERRKKQILSYIIFTISICVGIIIKDTVISNIIIYGMLIQTISITRFAYNITNNKYGYEIYENSTI